MKWKRIRLILSFYQKRARIFFVENENRVKFKIPKFIELASNWTRRQKALPTEVPTEGATEAPTAIELEVELEVEKESKRVQSYALPSKEEINESSIPKLQSDIKRLCNELYEKKIFLKAHAFANTMLKQKKNERAIIHALARCYLKKKFDRDGPWAYCIKIIQVEDGNFNEREYGKTKKAST